MSALLRPKVDISKLTPEEQKLFRLYGKLPNHKSVLMKMQKDRKYFDSGDYALSKAGVAPQMSVGTTIPNPQNIPHSCPSAMNGHQTLSTSPTHTHIANHSALARQVPEETETVDMEQNATPVAQASPPVDAAESPDMQTGLEQMDQDAPVDGSLEIPHAPVRDPFAPSASEASEINPDSMTAPSAPIPAASALTAEESVI